MTAYSNIASGGKDSIVQMAADGFGQALGQSFVDDMQAPNQSAAETARLSSYESTANQAEWTTAHGIYGMSYGMPDTGPGFRYNSANAANLAPGLDVQEGINVPNLSPVDYSIGNGSLGTIYGTTYNVQSGDNLTKIGALFPQYGSANDAKNWLIAANPQLKDPNMLPAGSVLNLPGSGTVFDAGAQARANGADARYQASVAARFSFSDGRDANDIRAGFGYQSMLSRQLSSVDPGSNAYSFATSQIPAQMSAISDWDAFTTLNPIGRVFNGFAGAGVALLRSPVTLVEGGVHLLQDAYGNMSDALFGPEQGPLGDERPYQPVSALGRSVEQNGLLGTLGNVITGTVKTLPGISLVNGLYQNNPEQIGSGPFMTASGGFGLYDEGAAMVSSEGAASAGRTPPGYGKTPQATESLYIQNRSTPLSMEQAINHADQFGAFGGNLVDYEVAPGGNVVADFGDGLSINYRMMEDAMFDSTHGTDKMAVYSIPDFLQNVPVSWNDAFGDGAVNVHVRQSMFMSDRGAVAALGHEYLELLDIYNVVGSRAPAAGEWQSLINGAHERTVPQVDSIIYNMVDGGH